MCAPFRLERCDFARILCCMREIKVLKHGQDYVTEKLTPVDSLSLVLSGRYFFSMPYRSLLAAALKTSLPKLTAAL